MTRKFFIQKKTGGIQSYPITRKNLKERYEKIGKFERKNLYQRIFYRSLASTTLTFQESPDTKESPTGLDIKAWRTDNKPMEKKHDERLSEIVRHQLQKYEKNKVNKKGETTAAKFIQYTLNGKHRNRRPSVYKHGKDTIYGVEYNQRIAPNENDAFRVYRWQVTLTAGKENEILDEGKEK